MLPPPSTRFGRGGGCQQGFRGRSEIAGEKAQGRGVREERGRAAPTAPPSWSASEGETAGAGTRICRMVGVGLEGADGIAAPVHQTLSGATEPAEIAKVRIAPE